MVDVSLLATAMWTLSSDVLVGAAGRRRRRAPDGQGDGRTRSSAPTARKDGRHIQLVFLESDRYWAGVLRGRSAAPTWSTTSASPTSTHAVEHARRAASPMLDEPSSPAARSTSGRSCSAGIDAPWARCRRSRSCSTTRRCSPTTTSARSSLDGEQHVPAAARCRCSSTSSRRDLRPGAGARRAHRVGAARARLRAGTTSRARRAAGVIP